MIKMIVTDLDGTLLNSKKEISTYTKNVLIEAQKRGVRLVLATGRNYKSLKPLYEQLEMDRFNQGAIIGVNGQEIYFFDEDRYFKGRKLTPQECEKLLKMGHRYLFEVMVMNDDEVLDCLSPVLFALKKIVYKVIHKKVTENFEGQMRGHRFIDVKTKIQESANKVGLLQIPLYVDLLLPLLHRHLDKEFEVLAVSKGWIEIMPKGVNKGAGLKEIMDHYHIKNEEVLVFGDGENDLTMLEGMVNSYAPDNALKSVKKSVRYICENHDLDGIAKIIEEKVLI